MGRRRRSGSPRRVARRARQALTVGMQVERCAREPDDELVLMDTREQRGFTYAASELEAHARRCPPSQPSASPTVDVLGERRRRRPREHDDGGKEAPRDPHPQGSEDRVLAERTRVLSSARWARQDLPASCACCVDVEPRCSGGGTQTAGCEPREEGRESPRENGSRSASSMRLGTTLTRGRTPVRSSNLRTSATRATASRSHRSRRTEA